MELETYEVKRNVIEKMCDLCSKYCKKCKICTKLCVDKLKVKRIRH